MTSCLLPLSLHFSSATSLINWLGAHSELEGSLKWLDVYGDISAYIKPPQRKFHNET